MCAGAFLGGCGVFARNDVSDAQNIAAYGQEVAAIATRLSHASTQAMLEMVAIVASTDDPAAKSWQAAEIRAKFAQAAVSAAGELEAAKPPPAAAAVHVALTKFLVALGAENEAAARFFRDPTLGAKARLASAQALTQTAGRGYQELRERLRETQGLELPVLNFPGGETNAEDAGRSLAYQVALNTALFTAPELTVPLAHLADSLSRLTGREPEREIRSLYLSAADQLRDSLVRLDAVEQLLARAAPPPRYAPAHELVSAGLDCLRRGLVEFELSFGRIAAGGVVESFAQATASMECYRLYWLRLWENLRSTSG